MSRRVFVFITMGSNIDPEANLQQALRLLGQQIKVHAVSQVYESPAIDAAGRPNPDQPPFLNAAVLAETSIEPMRLKYEVLRGIEAAMGRVRGEDKYAPRPIDLDIALYGDERHKDVEGRLTLPDPEIQTRAHIALPLADLAPGYIHPVTGQTLGEIAARFEGDPSIRLHPLTLYVT
ncbi:MAG: 2-amino-4-hydroxy-6-hydroxymethyldihydropteridine diphosphokinase [Anaerolineae bacterium]